MKKKLLFGLCGVIFAGGSYATANYYNGETDSKVEAQVVQDVLTTEEKIDMILSTTEAIEVVIANSEEIDDVVVSIGNIDKPKEKNDEATTVAETVNPTTENQTEPSATTEMPDAYLGDEGIHPTPDPVGPGGHPLVTEEPTTKTPTTEQPTTEQPTTEESRQEKVWVPDEYERVWVVDVSAWTEEIPMYEDHEAAECVLCGKILYTQAEVEAHGLYTSCRPLQYRNYPYSIQIGTETVYHEEEGHYENKLVREGHWEYR